MPAIQPARLKIHAVELAQLTHEPDEFRHAYYEFLEMYADRTYRSGLHGEPPALLQSYHVAQPVIRAILKELIPFAFSEKDSAIELTEILWAEPCLEFRLLAAQLIGQISPEPPELILERILAWILPTTDERLVDLLINSGLEQTRGQHPEIYIQQVETWCRSKKRFEQLLGLKAISPLTDRSDFEDIPLIFRLLAPFLRSSSTSLRPEILEVIETLANRSPQETAFFLEEIVNTSGEDSIVDWFVRHSLAYFPVDSQSYLREALLAKRGLD